MDSSVIAAIAAAVQASPDNLALRVHLATLLAQAQRWLESLEQAQTILARQPDHLEALELAAQACEILGEHERAESYRRLLNALGGKAPEVIKPESSSQSSSQTDLNKIHRRWSADPTLQRQRHRVDQHRLD
jgi:predicted Zn-dependent protease